MNSSLEIPMVASVMHRILHFLFYGLLGVATLQAEEPVTKILFGSCVKQTRPAPIFDVIVEHTPDLFLFLGDNVYADTDDMSLMRERYEVLGAIPGFQRLKKSTALLATWDDHDYGVNDGGADFPKRKEAQEVFLDFWGDADDSPRRSRDGVYGSQIFGPEGQRVQVILLDARFFRSPLKKGVKRLGGPYYPDSNPELTILGEEQWIWLEDELKKPAEIRIIGSGIQVVAEASGQETWSNLPVQRQRLFDTIAGAKANGVFLLSGDRHWSEFSRTVEGTPYPIYDFTSSSLNQPHPRGTPTKNRFRIANDTYHRENFGEIKINWAGANTRIEARIRDIRGNARISHVIQLPELSKRD